MKATFVIALFVGLLGGAVRAGAEVPRLRTEDPLLSRIVTRGLQESETFRQLYQRLESSNLIVHVQRGAKARAGAAFNQFVAQVGSYRFVRITINVDSNTDDAVALLGHELRHAVEVADTPSVEDSDDYERLYERIGYLSCQAAVPRCYETEAAVAAGRAVLRELKRKQPAGVAAARAAAQLIRRWVGGGAPLVNTGGPP